MENYWQLAYVRKHPPEGERNMAIRVMMKPRRHTGARHLFVIIVLLYYNKVSLFIATHVQACHLSGQVAMFPINLDACPGLCVKYNTNTNPT